MTLQAEPVKTIGVKEFRENLAEYMNSDSAVAVTKHGLTVGYYLPARHSVKDADKEALESAAKKLNSLLEAKGIDPEDLINDFKELKEQRKQQKKNA